MKLCFTGHQQVARIALISLLSAPPLYFLLSVLKSVFESLTPFAFKTTNVIFFMNFSKQKKKAARLYFVKCSWILAQ